MRVADISFYYDDNILTEEALLKQHYTTVGYAEALCRQGIEVIVVQRFRYDKKFVKNGVQYYFIRDGRSGSLRAWQISFTFLRTIAQLNADIVHAHNFPASLPLAVLRVFISRHAKLVIQNHGGLVPKGILFTIHRMISHIANAFFFTDVAQGVFWFKSKRLLKKAMPVMESATFFNYESRDAERKLVYKYRPDYQAYTGMHGNPVFLWVGRLDENKDPLLVLTGMEDIFNLYEHARLYMIFSDDKLLTYVRKKIQSSEILKKAVHLLGNIPHDELEKYYYSADYFVLGSHYEGSGFALSEALSCGCVPIVTDIPSFNMMTNKGKSGALWQVGNKDSFVKAVNLAMQKPLEQEANACIDFFIENLSFDAIAKTAISHYQKLLKK